MKADERKRLATEIAKMYYLEDLSQDEISKKVQMSRANVSRILRKCVENGVVEIVIHDTETLRPELAQKIKMHYGLVDVIIAPTTTERDRNYRIIGERLAQYLMHILKNGMLLGVAKGRVSYYAARTIENRINIHADVIQLQGATSIKSTSDEGQRLVSAFATKLNGRAFVLNAPIIVRSRKIKDGLIQSDIIGQIMQKYANVDVAVFDIEMPALNAVGMQRNTWLSHADILQLRELNAVSCVCGRFYDINGVSCSVGLHDRILAVDSEILKNIPLTIGVAAGEHMYETVLSTLRSGLVKVLLIDERLSAIFEEKLAN